MPSRIFTFGCSFTKCPWPTWADIIIKENGCGENWGRGGASNYYIFNAVIECNIRKKIKPEDTVIIMWTSVDRQSYYKNNQWLTYGSIHNNSFYSDEYLEKYYDPRGSLIRDYSMIYSIDQLLEKIGCKYYFLSMIDLEYCSEWEYFKQNNNKDLIKQYKFLLDKIKPSVYKVIFEENWNNRPNAKISDPRISKKLENFISQELDTIKDEYCDFAGTEWPNFDDYYYKNNLVGIKPVVLNEIKFLEKERNWNRLKKDYIRADAHPTPLEHLEYIEKVLPEFNISKETKNWVESADQIVLSMETIGNFWVNTQVERW